MKATLKNTWKIISKNPRKKLKFGHGEKVGGLKVTSEQVLCWPKRVDAQNMQKALLEATKENKGSKEFDAIKKGIKQNNRA